MIEKYVIGVTTVEMRDILLQMVLISCHNAIDDHFILCIQFQTLCEIWYKMSGFKFHDSMLETQLKKVSAHAPALR